MEKKNVAVFGSAKKDYEGNFYVQCYELGMTLAKNGFGVVTGGGKYGAMGGATLGARNSDGRTIGVNLEQWNGDSLCYPPKYFTEYHERKLLSERKQFMKDISCAFVIAPGGIGTMNEFWDVLDDEICFSVGKPIIILDICKNQRKHIKMALDGIKKANRLHKDIENLYWAKDSKEAFKIIFEKGS